jgi:amino acid transporter
MQAKEFRKNAPATTVDLRRNSLSFPATLAQSIANIAPTATPAMAVPFVAANAGNGTWFIFLVAMFGLILVGLNVSTFARRFASAGSLYTYIAKSLGNTAGFLSGWSMLVAYLFTGMATLVACTMFAQSLLMNLGLRIPALLLDIIGGGLICFLGYRDIRFSSLLAMTLELVSVMLIVTFGMTVLVKTGFHLDINQLTMKGTNTSGLALAMVLAIFSFVGFESSATLGKESRNPFRSIPRAVIISTLGVGIFFALMAYIEVLGFSGGVAGLVKSSAPLTDLSKAYDLGVFGILLNFGATLSFFSCSLASVNAAARVKFAMGRDQVLPALLGHVHTVHQSPHKAVIISSVITFVGPVLALIAGIADTDAYGYLGTIATYGFLVVYILISVASTIYMAREKMLRIHQVLLSLGGILFMAFPVVGSFYPVPSAPYNWLPYAFMVYLLAGTIWVKIVQNKKVNARLAHMDFEVNEKEVSVG